MKTTKRRQKFETKSPSASKHYYMGKYNKGLLIIFLLICAQTFGQNSLPVDSLNLAVDTTIIDDLTVTETPELVPNQGFSVNSLWRGALGMGVLVLISSTLSRSQMMLE